MKPGATLRVARPTDNLAAIAAMYARGLGFTVLTEFTDHCGFDGIILGHPKQPYHLEFTSQRGHQVSPRHNFRYVCGSLSRPYQLIVTPQYDRRGLFHIESLILPLDGPEGSSS
jgi:hypothetical protein